MELANQIIFISAFLLLFSVFAGLVSSRIGAPLLLTFLAVGMLFGEDGPGGIVFNDMPTAYLIASLSLAVILFDGGLRTGFPHFRLSLAPALSLATLGVVITAAIVGLFAAWLFEIPALYGLLFGAVLASTDAAAVFLLLHQKGVQLSERVRSVLDVESGLNDPMAVFLTIALVELLLMREAHGWLWFIGLFLQQMVIGVAVGYGGGKSLVWLTNRFRLAAGLYPVLTLAGSLVIYSGTALVEGSGFVAVYLAGLIMGNATFRYKDFTKRFYDGVAWLMQILMFIMIGLLVTPSHLAEHLVPALLMSLVLIFIARPIATFACLLPTDFNVREKTFMSWVGLRGAVPIFLAIIPALEGVDNSRIYFNIAFVVVVVSLVLQGWTVNAAAQLLRVKEPKTEKRESDA